MARRRESYVKLHERFSFLVDSSKSTVETLSQANVLIEIYPSDLEKSFADEFILSSHAFAERITITERLTASFIARTTLHQQTSFKDRHQRSS